MTPAQWRAAKRIAPVLDRDMAYIESGAGRPIVLLHGNPTSSYLWRSVLRPLTEEEMGEYRRPFAAPGEGRLPTLIWPRQIPIAGVPADVHEVCATYAAWLASAPGLSKLFINADPGSILTGAVRDFCRTWPDQAEVTVPGIHFIQEDSGAEIGRVIAAWLRQLPAGTRQPRA